MHNSKWGAKANLLANAFVSDSFNLWAGMLLNVGLILNKDVNSLTFWTKDKKDINWKCFKSHVGWVMTQQECAVCEPGNPHQNWICHALILDFQPCEIWGINFYAVCKSN
jgi:hypothetical protein